MQYKAFAMTDVGRVRDHNEDAFMMDPSIGVYVVCDGVRRCAVGDEASRAAVDTVYSYLHDNYRTLRKYRKEPTAEHRRAALGVIAQAAREANARLRELARHHRALTGVCSTMTALVVMGNSAVVAHVGDSRAYLCRRGRVFQLTDDHAVPKAPGPMISNTQQGSPDETPSKRVTGSLITRALGQMADVHVDLIHTRMMPGDRFLLCTDGLSDYFSNSELAKACAHFPDGKLVESLVQIANDRGGKDNITAVTVEAVAENEEELKTDLSGSALYRGVSGLRSSPVTDAMATLDLLDMLHRTVTVTAGDGMPYTLKALLVDVVDRDETAQPTPQPEPLHEPKVVDDTPFTRTGRFRRAAASLEELTGG